MLARALITTSEPLALLLLVTLLHIYITSSPCRYISNDEPGRMGDISAAAGIVSTFARKHTVAVSSGGPLNTTMPSRKPSSSLVRPALMKWVGNVGDRESKSRY